MRLITVLLMMAINASFASECPINFAETTIKGLYNPDYSDEPKEEFDYILNYKKSIVLSLRDYESIPGISRFSYAKCKDALIEFSFSNIKTNESFFGYYTFEDECDGGNSFGSIMDANGEYIAAIEAGNFQCFSK